MRNQVGDLVSSIRSGRRFIKQFIQSLKAVVHRPSQSGLKILYIPGFNSVFDLADQYYRMLWYFHPIVEDIDQIYIPCSFPESDSSNLPLPNYLDPAIAQFEPAFTGKVQLFAASNTALWREYLAQSQIFMNWKVGPLHAHKPTALLINAAMKTGKKWRVDKDNVQYEGSFYLKMSHDANRQFETDLAESQQKFTEMVQAVGKHQKGYIFGTGPSLAAAMDYDFSDGVAIACNSMVKNTALLERLNPKLIAIADPIFHAGCSTYAGEFRKHLYDAMDTYNPYLVVPFRDYKLYMENLPARFQARIIGIPLEHIESVNLDLTAQFVVKSTPNVMTLFLLPLACTLFQEVGMMGFDGRKIEDDQYFWSHQKESQFNEQMTDIQKAHPAFFKLDYNDYYLTHCDTLEQWIQMGEKRGILFQNLTHSYIPALHQRSVS